MRGGGGEGALPFRLELESGFGPSQGVQPHRVHSGSFQDTFQGIEPKNITINNSTSRQHPLQSSLS